jgi:hypothetical protein
MGQLLQLSRARIRPSPNRSLYIRRGPLSGIS